MGACGSQAQQAARPQAMTPKTMEAEANPCGLMLSPGSFQTACSDKDCRINPGQEKKVKNSGAVDALVMGVTCRKGRKPRKSRCNPNQDAWSLMLSRNGCRRVYGVYDGHGDMGHDASDIAKEGLPKLISERAALDTEDLKPSMMSAFHKTQTLLGRRKWSEMSGTTATVVVHDVTRNKLSVAHVGDSTAVVGRVSGGDGPTSIKAIQLTRDHKPELEDERKRIEASGGRVVNDCGHFRVVKRWQGYPGLNMSRSLGDGIAHNCGVLAEPEFSEHVLEEADQFLLLCSDGVWEVICPQEAMEIVIENGALQNPKRAVDALATEASRRWHEGTNGQLCDDITALLINIKDTSSLMCHQKSSDRATSTTVPSNCATAEFNQEMPFENISDSVSSSSEEEEEQDITSSRDSSVHNFNEARGLAAGAPEAASP